MKKKLYFICGLIMSLSFIILSGCGGGYNEITSSSLSTPLPDNSSGVIVYAD